MDINKICPICNTPFVCERDTKTTCSRKCSHKLLYLDPEKNFNRLIGLRVNVFKRMGIFISDDEIAIIKQKLQNGICEICGKETTIEHLDIDHCHKTGKIRGVICDRCNWLLGKLKDNIDLLDKFIIYLSK